MPGALDYLEHLSVDIFIDISVVTQGFDISAMWSDPRTRGIQSHAYFHRDYAGTHAPSNGETSATPRGFVKHCREPARGDSFPLLSRRVAPKRDVRMHQKAASYVIYRSNAWNKSSRGVRPRAMIG